MEDYKRIKKYTLLPYVTMGAAAVLLIISALFSNMIKLANLVVSITFLFIFLAPWFYFFYRHNYCIYMHKK